MKKLQVKKANFLVPLAEAVSKPAQLLASYLVASLPKSRMAEDDFPTLEFSYQELKRAINADGRERVNKVNDIFELGKELQKCILFYEDETSKQTVSWLTSTKQSKINNKFEYKLHPGLKKYLLNLENHFTKYNYLFRVCLNAHAMKLYEVLKMYQYLGSVVMHIENDLKPSLGLVGKYPKVYEFKRRVLNVAQKEFEKYTDIRFEYEIADKKGKTPLSYRFYIHKNAPTDLPESIMDKFKVKGGRVPGQLSMFDMVEQQKTRKDFPQIVGQLEKWGGSNKIITQLLDEYGAEKIKYQIRHLQRLLKANSTIKNPFAWLRKALKDNYQDTVQEKRIKKAVQIVKKQKENVVKEQLEKKIRTLKNKHTNERMALCNKLISQFPELLDEAIENGKHGMVISTKIQQGKTSKEIYADRFSKFAVSKEIQELRPEAFKRLNEKYQKEILVLEKELRKH